MNQLKDQIEKLSNNELLSRIKEFNAAYDKGEPLITDAEYDDYWTPALKTRLPDHDLNGDFGGDGESFDKATKVEHPFPMLSTNKAYSSDDILSFVKSVRKNTSGNEDAVYILSAKLDGMAGRLNKKQGDQLVTRGKKGHNFGYDISRVFEFGVPIVGNGLIGEFVVNLDYFNEFLSEDFDHPRGVVVGIASSAAQGGQPRPLAQVAIDDGAVLFVTYESLDTQLVTETQLLNELDERFSVITSECEYLTDGVVVEVVNEDIKEKMGHNSGYHRWQIAKKVHGVEVEVECTGVNWQTSRTGRVNPVPENVPVEVDGCMISNPTGHHAGRIRDWGVGKGAVYVLRRAGGVIPDMVRMVKSVEADIPVTCPSCGHDTEWMEPSNPADDSIFLSCPNMIGCPAQVENKIRHFFNIHGNVNNFGPSTIKKLVDNGFDSIPKIYDMGKEDFLSCGFGNGETGVLIRERQRSLDTPLEDWRFLGAMGIHFFGRGNARKLLKDYPFEALFRLTPDQIQGVSGFGEITSPSISNDLHSIKPLVDEILAKGFNIVYSKAPDDNTPISGKNIVFTGSMVHGKRDDMKTEALGMGASVQSSVNKKTDFLVCGDKVGQKKMDKASGLGVKVISEDDYIHLIKG